MESPSDQILDTGKIPQVPASVLRGPEDAHLPVSSQGMSSDLDNLTGAVTKNMTSLFPQVVAAEKEKAAAAKTDALAEAEQLGKYRENLSEIYKENKPTKVDMPPPPKRQDEDALRNFGSLASVIGVFGSMFTKKPIVNALNASAAAMSAQREGDKEKFDEAYKDWQSQIELGLKRHAMEVENLDQIMEIAKEDHGAALAQLKAFGVAHQSSAASVLAELGDWEEIGKYAASMQEMQVRGKESQVHLGEAFLKQQTALTERQVYEDALAANLAAGQPKASAEANALAASKGKSGVSSDVMDGDTLNYAATLYREKGVLPALGMGQAAVNARAEIIKRAAKEAKSEGGSAAGDIVTQATVRADAQSLGSLTKMADSAVSFENTALKNMNVVKSLMDQGVGTGLGPVFNRWIQAGRKATGSPGVAAFNAAMDTVANEYAKIMSGSTGSMAATEAARTEAQDMVSKIQTPDQIEKVFSTMRRDMDNRTNSLTEQRNTIQERIKKAGAGNQTSVAAAGLPDSARQQLKAGTHTTFGNGQVWTLDDNGQPQQVK